MEGLEFRILGQMEVLHGGERLALGGHRQLAVLAVLAVDAGRVVSSDRLVDALWGEEAPSGARATVQAYVSKLRRALHPDRYAGASGSVLDTQGPGYVLRIDPEAIDARRFERLSGEGRAALAAGDAEAATELLGQALALWRGPALADFAFDSFAAAEIARLEELRLTVTEDQVEAALALGRHRAVVGDLEQLVAAYPFRERLRAQLMLALYRSGRQAEALRAYQTGRRVLAEELGIDPSPALKELEGAILRQDATLDWVASERAVRLSSLAPDRLATVVPPPDTEAGGRPSETVTFLLTDMERSTRLWTEHPGAAAVMARHHDLVAQVVEGRGGILPGQSEGDSVLAVFSRASQAVSVALDIQRALAAEPWPDGVTVRVRIGLHTGEAVIRRGNYYGLAVNRAARLRALAHGGQVLCSQATAEVVADHLPPEAWLRDMGVHRLSDLDRPEHVFQICHPDVRSEFPALPSPESPPHNLPAALTSFVGRRQELAEVKKVLEGARLVSLVGAGGVGKTRLALEVALELVGSHPEGVWLADLAPLSHPSLVPEAVADALRLREGPGQPVLDTLAEYLRHRRVLLVLDNCDHVVAASATLVESLLRAAPGLHVLATSREPLGVPGEVAWRVPSLATPHPADEWSLETLSEYESVQLFLERAEAARPGLTLRPEDARALAQICARLDGIPLAIELAAARVGVLGLEQIATRLDDRFALLTGGARTALPRHQTLRAAVEWSHDQLSGPEQLLFRRLGVFSGGFTLETAEAVCALGGPGDLDTPEVLDLLSNLVDKSLVLVETAAGATRYRLLETIRDYAREQTSEEGDTVADRHLGFFTDLAERAEPGLTGPEQGAWLQRLEADRDNLRAALDWATSRRPGEAALRPAAALWRFWWVRGHWSEGRELLEAALAGAAGSPSLPRAKALKGLGNLVKSQGDYPGARSLHEQALAEFRELGDRSGVADCLNNLGVAAWEQGDHSGARSSHEEALAIRRELDDLLGMALSLNNLGLVTEDEGEARSLYDEALADFRELGHPWGVALCLTNLGSVAERQGDFAAARSLHTEALALRRELGDLSGVAVSLDYLGVAASAQADHQGARLFFEEALALCRQLGDKRESAACLEGLARLAADESRYRRSARLFGAAEALREAIGAPLDFREQARHDEALVALGASLGQDALRSALAEGRAMTLEGALAYAADDPGGIDEEQPGKAGDPGGLQASCKPAVGERVT